MVPPQKAFGQGQGVLDHLAPKRGPLDVILRCPNCEEDPPNIIEEYDNGDLVCGTCGTVLGDKVIDTRSEWRNFSGDEGGDDPSRVGSEYNPLLANVLSTSIASLGNGKNDVANNLRRAQSRMEAVSNGGTSHAALTSAFSRIADRCQQMHLPRTVEQRAQHIYKLATERKAVRGGRHDTAIIAACIIMACRDAHADRSYAEVCKAMSVSKKELGQAQSLVRQALAGDLQNAGIGTTKDSVEGMLARFTNNLALGNAIHNAAKYVNSQASKKGNIDGRSPLSIAAGILWFTIQLFQNPTTIRDVQKITEVSDSTIKLVCKLAANNLDDVIRPEWKEQFPAGYEVLALIGRNRDTGTGSNANNSRAGTPTLKSAMKKNKKEPTPLSSEI